jgi:prepilin-type N-terminal cleavage/methylation domain-containing protein
MTSSRESGVTLIEVLIAVTLVSLLSTGILMAIRIGLLSMEKANTRLMANRRVAGAHRILEQQIAGFMPVAAECMPAPGQRVRIRFFQGEPGAMRFVSSHSIQEASRGIPQVLEFVVIPGQDGAGVRLVVNEHPYAHPGAAGAFCLGVTPDPALGVALPRFPPIQTGPFSFVLADRLAFCRFIFRENLPVPPFERWVPRWIKPEWPAAVRIEMAPLLPDPSRLQMMTVTAPLRARKDPLIQYAQ